jgi:hypothetical protein
MLETIEKLLILQDRDRRIRRLEGELAHIEPERQALKAKASGTLGRVEQLKDQLKQIESDRKSLELEVSSKKEAIIRYANQQFQTRKNEEYRALAKEIDTCKADIFQIEEKEIGLMEKAEATQKHLVVANQEAGEARKRADEHIAQLNLREQNLQKELTLLQANRGELAEAVNETARGRYERLLRSKGENVVVGVQHGVCGGCHMKLPPQLLVMCQAKKEIVTCSNCGRILYYTSDMDLAIVD